MLAPRTTARSPKCVCTSITSLVLLMADFLVPFGPAGDVDPTVQEVPRLNHGLLIRALADPRLRNSADHA